jgi:hypothetical protein
MLSVRAQDNADVSRLNPAGKAVNAVGELTAVIRSGAHLDDEDARAHLSERSLRAASMLSGSISTPSTWLATACYRPRGMGSDGRVRVVCARERQHLSAGEPKHRETLTGLALLWAIIAADFRATHTSASSSSTSWPRRDSAESTGAVWRPLAATYQAGPICCQPGPKSHYSSGLASRVGRRAARPFSERRPAKFWQGGMSFPKQEALS